ncbi:MAG: hypothetical protein AAF125_01555 [Chloroflexota bacterium]
MPLTFTTGDPFTAPQQTIGFGINAAGRTETSPIGAELALRYPAMLATYRKAAKRGRLQPGALWLWTESTPRVLLLIVRETSVGATRPRFVDAAALKIARDHALYGIESLALAPLGRQDETDTINEALGLLLHPSPLEVVAYTAYVPKS